MRHIHTYRYIEEKPAQTREALHDNKDINKTFLSTLAKFMTDET